MLFFTLFVSSFGFAQIPNIIEWGSDNLVNSRIGLLLPDNHLNFYTAEFSQGFFRTGSSVSRYENGKKIKTKKIKTNFNGKQFNIEEIITFRGQLIVFFSEKQGGVNTLFLLRYDEGLEPFDKLEEIASYSYGNKLSSKGSFNITKSFNEDFFCAEYLLPGKNTTKDLFGCVIYDSLTQVKQRAEFEIPFNPTQTAIEARHLSNDGKYALGISVFSYSTNGLWRDYSKIEKSVLFYVDKDTIQQYELFLDKNRIYNYEIHSKKKARDPDFFVTGTYGEEANGGAKGVFYQRIDLTKKKEVLAKVFEFPSEILENETNENRLLFMENQNADLAVGNQLLNYAFRNVFPQDDGGLIIVAEQYYFYEQATTDARGMTQMISHYQYNDLLFYKIDSAGNFSWIKKIPKSQHSTNDFGFFLSSKVIENKDELFCYFNDNAGNYDDLGKYRDLNRTFNFPTRKKNYALAEVSINCADGKEKRRIISLMNDTDGYVSLKISQVNNRTNEFIVYSTRKRDRFGLLIMN